MSGNAKPILNVMAIIFTLALAMFYVGVTVLKEVVRVQNFLKVRISNWSSMKLEIWYASYFQDENFFKRLFLKIRNFKVRNEQKAF